jgi:hypothetical protein
MGTKFQFAPEPFTPGFNISEQAWIDGNIVHPNHPHLDQALYTTGPSSMAIPLASIWQGCWQAPPLLSYDFGLFDLP